jgi:uncharacterized repeat protein (TIGR01451 family)
MSKVMLKLMLIIGLALIGLASLWLNFISKPWPAQASEAPFDYVAAPAARPLSAGFNITVSEVVAQGFTIPIQVTNAGDGSGRLFVVEQDGKIKIVKSGVVLGTPFLDISSLVRSPSDGGGSEEGLLGLAFHPNYETNGHFYVYYNDNNGDIVIARYSVSGNPVTNDVANPSSGVTVLPIGHPTNGNHNGGQLAFGPLDGYLYINTGDGGGSNDVPNNAQNVNVLLGKILRLNVTGVTTYTIPPTNPYVGVSGDDRIWAIGLRNPWRSSFDRANGDLYIGDVGQNTWEEISYQAAGTPGGVNFGWRCREGAHNFNFSGNCSSLTLTDPIAEYDHSLGFAVTGGFVYRGSRYPALYGYYFYADFSSRRIWSMTKTGPTSWSTPEEELVTNFNISAFGEDEQGEVYVVDYSGKIRRLADVTGPSPALAASQKTASDPGIDPGETLTYTILIKNISGLPSAETVFLTDRIPNGLAYVPGSLSATQGSTNPSQNPTLRWQGALSPTAVVTVTYQVTATGLITGLLINRAVITTANLGPITRTFPIFVPRPLPFYLPQIYK